MEWPVEMEEREERERKERGGRREGVGCMPRKREGREREGG